MKTVKKAIISKLNNLPLAIINVPSNVRKVPVAGTYTITGDAVNVMTHNVTANKRVMKAAETANLYVAVYHDASGTYRLVETYF